MKSYDGNTIAAIGEEGIILRDFIFIRGKNSSGVATNFGFWTGDGTVTTNVTSAIDSATESRTYIGNGSVVNVPPMPFVIGLEVRTIEISLSQVHSDVQSMVRSNDIRHAVVEVHRGYFGRDTGQLVANPLPRFLGKVDEIEVNTPSAGDEGEIIIRCASNTSELVRLNTARKSDETQQLRSSDKFRQYADVAGQWEIWWGELQSDGTSQPETPSGIFGWGWGPF